MIDVPAGHLCLGEGIDPQWRGRNGEAVLLGRPGRGRPPAVETVDVPLEKSDITVTALSLVWVPAA